MTSQGTVTVTTPRGRTFLLSWLEWATELEKQGFEYDYAFEIVKAKRSFGLAWEYLKKHPKRSGLFAGKKRDFQLYPRLNTAGIVINHDGSKDMFLESTPSRFSTTSSTKSAELKKQLEAELKNAQEPSLYLNSSIEEDDAVPEKHQQRSKSTKAGNRSEEEDFEVVSRKKHQPKSRSPSHQKPRPQSARASPEPSPVKKAIASPPKFLISNPPVKVVVEEEKYEEVVIPVHNAPVIVIDDSAVVAEPEMKEAEYALVNKNLEAAKLSYAQALSSPAKATPVSSPFKKVASSPAAAKVEPKNESAISKRIKAFEEKIATDGDKPSYKVGDELELLRSNGQWVECKLLEKEGKRLVVEYYDEGKKYQKRMGIHSNHLAPKGTHIKVEKPASPKKVEEEEDDGFNVVKAKLHLKVKDGESPRKFHDTMRTELTESTMFNPKYAASMAASVKQDFGATKAMSVMNQSVYSAGPVLIKDNHLLNPNKETPSYTVGDLVNIRCSDGHWYRGRVLDVGEHAVLVEYKRKRERFQKKLPIRSKLLRHADEDDVLSIKTIQSVKASSSKKVPLEMIMKGESKTPVAANKTTVKGSQSAVDLACSDEKLSTTEKQRKSENESLTDSRSDSRSHVELLRRDGIWYEAFIIKSGGKSCIVEYINEGKKFQKTVPNGSDKLAPFGTHIFVAEVGDDVEYLTPKGEWVKAQICEIQEAFYIILYMEGSDLVEKKIVRCSENLARYGEHTGERHLEHLKAREIKV